MNKIIYISIIVLIVVIIFGILIFGFFQQEQEKEQKIEVLSTYKNPIVPTGFKTVDTENAKWIKQEDGTVQGWNDGLIIEDEVGNQFVWIPVKEEIITYPNLAIEDEFQYDFKNLDINNEEEKQIIKYGGFYISRYEAGVSNEMQERKKDINAETNDIKGVPVSKKNMIPWNYISLKNAKINAESMYNALEISSGLPTLKQMQYIIAWLNKSKYDVYNDSSNFGNYSNVKFEFTGWYSDDYGESYKYGENVVKGGSNMILSTGATNRNMTKNIYDLAGNLWEYTNDYLQINENEILGYYCVGGHYDNTGESYPAYSYNLKNVAPLEKVGFRIVLKLL